MSLQGSHCEGKGGLGVEEVPEEDGCDELGSRLEEELNRSIEKMREEEEEAAGSSAVAATAAQEEEEEEKEDASVPVERLISLSDSLYSSEDPSASATPKPSSSLSPHSPVELLQDVEMPTCNISYCEATKLLSSSPTTPHHASIVTAQQIGDPQQAPTESTTQSHLETAILLPTSPSPSDNTSLSDSVFTEEEKQHTGSSPHSFFELLQNVEMPSYNLSSCELSKQPSFPSTSPTSLSNSVSNGSDSMKTASEAAPAKDIGAGGPTPPHLRGTMEAVDIEKMDTGFLVVSPIKKLHLQAAHHPLPSSPDDPEVSKQGNDTLSSSTVMSEAILVLSELERASANLTSSPESPSRRMTIHPLDMEWINDSLLSSPLRHPPKNLVPQGLSLPFNRKKEENDGPQSNNTAMKDMITKPQRVKGELSTATDEESLAMNVATEGCLESKNYAATETNQTLTSSGHPVIEGEAAVGMTGGLKRHTADTNSPITTTFDFKLPLKKENTAANTTFDFKLPRGKKDPAANTTFVMSEKENPAANTTFEFNKVSGKENPVVDTTFDCNKLPAERGNTQVNTTFECKRPLAGEKQAANTTLNTDSRPTGGKDHQAAANTTFDCNQERNRGVDTTFTTAQKQNPQPSSSSHSKNKELNITFEKGEYRIGDQNETVNLMDAEENVLQVILDATPKKVSHQVPKAASTPKTSGFQHQPHLKAGLTKASPMNFLHRLLDGTKQEGHQEPPPITTLSSTSTTSTTTTTGLLSFPTSLKFGGGQQQQQRRQHGPGVMRPGPMKALPLSTLVTNAAHLQEHLKSAAIGSGDEHSGGSTSSTKGTLAQRRRTATVPSFGSLSSIENDDMSGTPDCVINHNTSISSPETFRIDVLSCGPRITSTPTFGGHRAFPDVMEMDGAIPTPISQVSSRPRFSELISSSFQGSSTGSSEKEGATRKASRDGTRHKNLPDQPPAADAEVPQPSQPPQSPSAHSVPPFTLQPSSAKPVLPSTPQPPSVEPVLPPTLQPPSFQSTHPSSPQPTQLPLSQPLEQSSSQPHTSQSISCQLSHLSASQPPQPSSLSLPEKLQKEDDTTKKSKECDEQKKRDAHENEKLDAARTSVSQTTQAPFPQTTMNVTVTVAQPPVPSVVEIQPPAPPTTSAQPSSPPGTTAATEATGDNITATAVQSSSSSLLPPPPTTNRTVQPSSPHAATRKPQTHVNDKVGQIKPKRSTLVLSSTTKTALLTTGGGGAGAKKDGKLKRESFLQKPMNTRGKQLQPMCSIMDKENRRKSGTVDSKQTHPPPSQMETGGQPPQRAPLLSKRNPSPRLILKSSNTNIKKTISKPKFTNRALAAKDEPMKVTVGIVNAVKSMPEVQTDEAGSAKDKGVLRKPSPQPCRDLSRTLSGSRLPRNTSAPESTKPPLKTLSSHSKKLPSPVKRPEAEMVSRSKLPSMSGSTIPITHSSKNPSSAPQIKATLPVRSSEALRRKPSLLKTPKPVL